MVIFFSVILKELFEKGRKYPWPRIDKCPKCGACKVWKHGYVTGIFDGFNQLLFLKRYRCPDCRCVFRCRPSGFFKRFQSPIDTIRKSILSKESKGRWLQGISRTRQAHWWRALKRRIAAFSGNTFRETMVKGFDYLRALCREPVTRCI